MARDAITIAAGTMHAAVADPVGTTITPANGGYLAAGGDTAGLLVIIRNTTVSAKIVTFKEGVYSPGLTAGQGDLALSIGASSVKYVFLESARFVQNIDSANSYPAGRIDVDFESAMTGTITAVRLPVAARV